MCKPVEKAKKERFTNLDVYYLSGNKTFGQFVRLPFPNKVKAKATVKFLKNYDMIDDEIKMAKLFDKYFVNIAN